MYQGTRVHECIRPPVGVSVETGAARLQSRGCAGVYQVYKAARLVYRPPVAARLQRRLAFTACRLFDRLVV